MFQLDPGAWALTGICAFLIGIAKSGISGATIVVPPVMAMIFPARESTGILLPMLIMGDILAVAYYHRHADWKVIARILPFAAVGVVIGFLTLGSIDNATMQRILAILVAALIALTLMKEGGLIKEDRIPRHTAFAALMGVLAGFTTMLANAAGPVMIVYLIAMNLKKEEFIGTAAWFFLIVNVFKVPFSYSLGFITAESLLFNLKLFILILAGAASGIILIKNISQKTFRVLILLLALGSSVKLFF